MSSVCPVQKADPHLRRKALRVLVTLTLLGAALLVFTAFQLHDITEQFHDNPEHAIRKLIFTIRVTTGMGAFVFTPAGLYFAFFGISILKTGIYPPEGSRVFRDTVVREGFRAKMTGAAFVAGGALLVTIVNFLFWYAPFALERAALQ